MHIFAHRHDVQSKRAKSVHLSEGYVNALQLESEYVTVSSQVNLTNLMADMTFITVSRGVLLRLLSQLNI